MAKKDFYAVWTYKSPEGDKDISLPNLEVINLLKSLKSSGYVKETFNWWVVGNVLLLGRPRVGGSTLCMCDPTSLAGNTTTTT